jgi:glycosyltransferase involved in cell wall biosynthesis
MKRVVILVENLPVPLDRRVWQEATTLRDAGWSVTVIGPRGGPTMRRLREHRDGILVLRYPQRAATGLAGYLLEYGPSLLFSLGWLLWVRLHGRIDVIHGCNPPDLFWLIGIVGRLTGARYVYDQHDANPELSQTKFGDRGLRARLLLALTTWLERRNYRLADLVIAPNDTYADLARSRGRIAEDRLAVVRNAPDLGAYRSLASGATVDPHRVGYVGVMGSQDALDLLIDAWSRVVRADGLADAHLELIGDGEARVSLERQAERLGIASTITFHGYQQPDVFVPILASCALCVNPDPPTPFNSVSTMTKVVDYLVIGRPVVAFALQETATVIGDGGRIVAPTAEALAAEVVALLRDPERIAGLAAAAAARPKALGLSWDESARRLVEAYDLLAPIASGASESLGVGSKAGRPTPR